MRWEAQRADADEQPALIGLPGLVRSVRTPEFAGVVFHEVRAKSVLNRVPGGSSMPFGWTVNPYRGCSHACTYCLSGATAILMADGRTKPLAELRVGDQICGTRGEGGERRYVTTRVLAHWSTVKPAYRVTLEDGTLLISSGDHRFLTVQGWKHVVGATCSGADRPQLTVGDRLVGTGSFAQPPVDDPDYRLGYLRGMTRGEVSPAARSGRAGGPVLRFQLAPAEGEALQRTQQYLAGIATTVKAAILKVTAWPVAPSDSWHRGFLAGAFDADGSFAKGVLSIANTNSWVVDAVSLAMKNLDFDHEILDPATVDGRRVVRLSGGLAEQLRFLHTVDPAGTRKRALEGLAIGSGPGLAVASIEAVGLELPLFDITTGTGDFIANGVVSHNCFARNSHTYLDLDAGKDFDTQVVVKVNAAEVLTGQLRSRRWAREHVAMGTNTDPYQRAEGRYALMPGIIRALASSGTPFSILTKGTILGRDLPLLREAAKEVSVGLGVSIALLDREVQRSMEPGTPSPQARLDLVRRISDAGLGCGVFLAPVLPWLTDSSEQLDALLGQVAAAGASGVTVLPLHLRPGAREWFLAWLAREHPQRVAGYQRLYAKGSYVDKRYREWLAARVGPLLRRHGLDRRPGGDARGIPGDDEGRWPKGSLPGSAAETTDPPPRIDHEQLTLL